MEPETFYHIYNRGNNQLPLYFTRENYLYFLRKAEKYLLPHVDLIAYCLMPNHFHLLVFSRTNMQGRDFSNDLRVMLRSYTRAINNQEKRTGSLFQQHTKIKPLEGMDNSHGMTTGDDDNYPFTCFHYIHQNPMKAGLVKRMEDWEMSSFRDFAGLRNESLCNKKLACELLEVPESYDLFVEQSYKVFDSGTMSSSSHIITQDSMTKSDSVTGRRDNANTDNT